MSQSTKMKFHQEVRTIDLPDIAARYTGDPESFRECQQLIDAALIRIKLFPEREGKPCQYEPLAGAGFRKVRLFSMQLPPIGVRKDLRIVYRFDGAEDAVEVLSIGFRLKERPRPPEDPYSRAEARNFDFE